MKNTMIRKILSLTVAILFLVNNLAFALGPGVVSNKLGADVRGSGTKEKMNATGRKLMAIKKGPGTHKLLNALIRAFWGKSFYEVPDPLEKTQFFLNDEGRRNTRAGLKYLIHPAGGEIMSQNNLVEALKLFRDKEAKISPDVLDIREGYFPVDEKTGRLPIARIEKMDEGKYTLIVHTKFVQMWEHVLDNDVWFRHKFQGLDELRTVSVAWGLFYRLAKHEMSDIKKIEKTAKEGGHISILRDEPAIEDEANKIGGRYNVVNDAIWLWFLGSYCMNDAVRHNNFMFGRRTHWIFEDKKARELNLHKEFPNFKTYDEATKKDFFDLAKAINYYFFKREDVKVTEISDLTVSEDLIHEYQKREYYVRAVDDDFKAMPSASGLKAFKKYWHFLMRPMSTDEEDENVLLGINELVKRKVIEDSEKDAFEAWYETFVDKTKLQWAAHDFGELPRSQYVQEVAAEMIRDFEAAAELAKEKEIVEAAKQLLFIGLSSGDIERRSEQYKEGDSDFQFDVALERPLREILKKAGFDILGTGFDMLAVFEQPPTVREAGEFLSKVAIEMKTIESTEKPQETQDEIELELMIPNITSKEDLLFLRDKILPEGGIDNKDFERLGSILKSKSVRLATADSLGQARKLMQQSVRMESIINKQLQRLEEAKKPQETQDEIELELMIPNITSKEDLLFLRDKILPEGGIDNKDFERLGSILKSKSVRLATADSLGQARKLMQQSVRMESIINKQLQRLEEAKKTEHPLIKVLSEHVVDVGKQKGPDDVEVRLSPSELQNIYETVNLLRKSRIEILFSQNVKLTRTIKKALDDIEGNKSGDIINCKSYSGKDNLTDILKQNVDANVKRIIITDNKTSVQVGQLVSEQPELFEDKRLLNIALPKSYAKDEEETAYQARTIMLAVCARLYEGKKTPMIEAILKDMLQDHLDGGGAEIDNFIANLVESEEEKTSPQKIAERINYFLGKTVRLIQVLQKEIELVKNFWISA